jgi:hypothetical protein
MYLMVEKDSGGMALSPPFITFEATLTTQSHSHTLQVAKLFSLSTQKQIK